MKAQNENEINYDLYIKRYVEKIEQLSELLKIPSIMAYQISSDKIIYSFIPISKITDKRFYGIEKVIIDGDLGFVTISTKSKQQYEKLQYDIKLLLDEILVSLEENDLKTDTDFSIIRAKIENFIKDNILSILE